MNNEIKLYLTIDDVQSAVKIKGTDAAIVSLQGSLDNLQKNPAIKTLTNDLLSLDKATGESAEAVVEFAKSYGLSEKQLNSMINTLRVSQSILGVGTKEYQQNKIAVDNLTSAMTLLNNRNLMVNSSARTAGGGIGSFNSLVGQTGFLLSDLDMMFVNFSMGMMSIGNNISMVAQTAGYAIQQAKDQNLSFGAALKQSLTGFNLWILGINAGMFVIQALTNIPALIQRIHKLNPVKDCFNATKERF